MLGRTKASWREKASGRGTRSLLFGPQHIQVEAETTPCSPREGGRREDALRTERFVSLVLCRARDILTAPDIVPKEQLLRCSQAKT